MKKYILKSLFVSVLCMLAASCQDTEIVETLEASQAQIVFPIALDSPSARSRSSWDGYTGLGNGNEYDSHIDFNQFIVQIEAKGKTYPVTSIIQLEGGNKFVGIVDEEIKSETLQNAKISIFANMGKESVAETFSQDAENIPMWGVKTVSKLEFAPGKREEVDDPVFMLRAMAKMEVALTPECAAEYDLKAVTLNKHNATGYCLPVGVDAATNTQNMSTAGVFNPKAQGEQTSLQFEPATETSYVVYLPEVAKGTTEEDCLKIEVQLLPKNAPEGTEPEIGTFAVMNYPQNGEPEAINIIRNHWYKYTISGFAASEIQLDYAVVDWQDVGIEIGGDGFLFLNKDVIEIYNSNIDADQLKFSSSSPIDSIKLVDLYTHEDNGDIIEGAGDGVNAYYISKFGQKIQLGTDPGFDYEGKEDILANEKSVLNAISATFDPTVTEGNITINSPFIGHSDFSDSHNDTPRYLEFKVYSGELWATFRVVQYPPVVITNQEGYFSYREDFNVADLPVEFHENHFTANTLGSTMPVDNGEATHYLNPTSPFFCCADFYPYHVHEWDIEKGAFKKTPTSPIPSDIKQVCGSCGTYIGFDEMTHGLMEREYMRVDQYKGSPESGVFHRTHHVWDDGSAFIGGNIAKPSYYYQNLGPIFEREVEVDDVDLESGEVVGKKKVKKYYRRHYTGNSFIFYFGLFVQERLANGKAVINSMAPSTNPVTKNEWTSWGWYSATWNQYTKIQNANHRIYHIRATSTPSDCILGWPELENIDGRTYTAEGKANSRMVSPSFMVASQLGTTWVPYDRDGYIVPKEDGMYSLAKRQCEQYVEAVYKDIDGDGYTAGKDSVTHYNDWRLPTDAELQVIINYQRNSRAMDKVLDAESYFCASKDPNNYNSSTVLTFLDKVLDQWTTEDYHIRCVRDVKPGQNLKPKLYPLNVNNE